MATPGVYIKKEESFLEFLWNKERKEFLGRTGSSWAKIGIFYVIFYACLAAFFAATLAVFYQTLDTENKPTYTPGAGGSILKSPALGFRPRPREENIESTLIWYTIGDESDELHWAGGLTNFTKDYEENTNAKPCDDSEYMVAKNDSKAWEKICSFERDLLGGYCSDEQKWGYSTGSPCILLKLNRMLSWEPDVYKNVTELPDHMPKRLRQKIEAEYKAKGYVPPVVWLSCEGENPADKEYLPTLQMYPTYGFPAYYFPYQKSPNYRSPLVAVRFEEPTQNVLINIECRLWAKNIEHVKQNRLGVVHFELLID